MQKHSKTHCSGALGLALAALMAAPVAAENEGWYLNLGAYHTQLKEADTDDFRATENCVPLLGCSVIITEQNYDSGFASDENFGISIGYDYQGPMRAELEIRDFDNAIDRLSFDSGAVSGGSGSVETTALLFNFWYDFNNDSALRPYLGGGFGIADLDLGGEDDQVVLAQLGAGVSWALAERVTVDLGYRYALADDPEFESSHRLVKSEYEAESYVLGVRYNFFDRGQQVNDGDGDGVANRADRCPGTPRGVVVDERGCPLDGDGDGVPDYLDQCQNSAAGSAVNAVGCNDDGDGDGVANAQDQCPNTPAGQRVMSNGCAAEQLLVLEGMSFENNSATLTAEGQAACARAAKSLRKNPGFAVEVQGHTDSAGAEDYNQRLSQQRAEAVVACLVEAGVNGSRLQAKGYGESQPLADNDSAEGRARNRRVALKVLGS